jgi:hypothetical protein
MPPAADAARAQRDGGGVIAIGGVPLAGKALVTARLGEYLPRSLRLETIDDLSHPDEVWLPEGPGGPLVRDATQALLARAGELWKERDPARPPVILVCARFSTPQKRRAASRLARALGARFLFVEARSRDVRALRRIPVHRLSRSEEERRLRRYEDAVRRYRPVDATEAARLPAMRLTRVHSGLEQAVARVVKVWERQ